MTTHYCLATHPDKPNDTANSRGRKYHITLDEDKTLCKNIVTHLIGAKDDVYDDNGRHNGGKLRWSPTQYHNGLCGNCRNIAEQKHLSIEKMGY